MIISAVGFSPGSFLHFIDMFFTCLPIFSRCSLKSFDEKVPFMQFLADSAVSALIALPSFSGISGCTLCIFCGNGKGFCRTSQLCSVRPMVVVAAIVAKPFMIFMGWGLRY